jgi:hypothetical protein
LMPKRAQRSPVLIQSPAASRWSSIWRAMALSAGGVMVRRGSWRPERLPVTRDGR